MNAVFDSPILIDYLNGVPAARTELLTFQQRAISIITWMEILVGAPSYERELVWRDFMRGFQLVQLTAAVSDRAIRLRRERRLKLPDAIVLATAHDLGVVLVTRNTKDFPASDPSIRVPYQL